MVAAVGGLGLGVSILVLSLWQQGVSQVTKEIGADQVGIVGQPIAAVGLMGIGYPFPEAGRLPDYPLYFIQMLEDRWETWQARGIHEQVALNITHSDIRLMAARELFNKDKLELAAESSFKAERYLSLAVDELKSVKENGDKADEWGQVLRAARAHEQVLGRMIDKANRGRAQLFAMAMEENRRIQNEAGGRGVRSVPE